MRRAMTSSSSRADATSACGMCGSLASRSRRRSTARPRRALSAATMVPTAVSMNTGATASWMTPEISWAWTARAMARSLARLRAAPDGSAGHYGLVAVRRGRWRGSVVDLLLLLLLVLLLGTPVLAIYHHGGGRSQGAGHDPLPLHGAERLDEIEQARIEFDCLVVALALQLQAPDRRLLL